MHLKIYKLILTFFFVITYLSICAQPGCQCNLLFYQIADDSTFNYEFFYRKINVTLTKKKKSSPLSYEFLDSYFEITNRDTIIYQSRTIIGQCPDTTYGNYVSWQDRICCEEPVKVYLIITEKSTQRKEIIMFPIFHEIMSYDLRGYTFKEGSFWIEKYDRLLRENEYPLVPCENDLPPNFMETCPKGMLNKSIYYPIRK